MDSFSELDKKAIGWFIDILESKGKLNKADEAKVLECRHAIEYGLATRDKTAVEKTIRNVADSYKYIENVSTYLYRCFGRLPLQPPPKTIREEVQEELQQVKEHEKMMDDLNSFYDTPVPYYTEPNDPKLLAETTILNCMNYKGEEELYAANTFIALFREAKAQKTSVHELCRRKGLVYGWVIW